MTSSSASTIDEQLAPYRGEIDAALARYSDFPPDCPEQLGAAIRYMLLAPGKRLRPLLALLAAEACGAAATAALPVAAAVEMVHTYSLIHDDLPAMDDDDLRRGQPTCHRRFDEATAILAGDALLARAFEVTARDIEPPATAARCCAELAHAAGATQLVGGQADDLAGHADDDRSDNDDEATLARLEAIHRRKTGAMFQVALRLGGLAAGAGDEQLAALDACGRHLGLAFQVTDDLLDVGGDPRAVGKRLGKDSGRGKLTYPGLVGAAESRRRAAALIDAACDSLQPLGPPAEPLAAVFRYVLERTK